MLTRGEVWRVIRIVSSCLFILPFFSFFVQAGSTLNFPRLSFEAGTFTGFAIANPTTKEAVVTLTAYGANGQPLAGLTNPASLTVPANQQIAEVTSDVFGQGSDPATVAWFQATSPADDLTGFFLFLDGAFTILDGADLPPTGRAIVFPRVRLDAGYKTEINLINPGTSASELQVRLIRAGSTSVDRSLSLPPKGAARLDVADFFGITQAPSAFVSVTSTALVAGFELVRSPAGDVEGLNARSTGEQLSDLYFPQMVALGPWQTELGVVNNSAQAVILTLSAYRPDGSLYDTSNVENNPVTRSLEPGGILATDVVSLFGFKNPSATPGWLEGWMRIESTAPGLGGFISYGVPATGLVATVTPSGEGQTRALISHIATISGFFTGVAALNAGQLANNLRVLAMTAEGQLLGTFDTVLQPGQRISKTITELVPAAADQNGGMIWVKSDLPLFLTSLFGSARVLSNVPPQPPALGFAPDQELESLRITPPLAVVQPGGTIPFSTMGPPTPGLVWKVNGIEGGSASIGTINSSGSYTAPAAIPDPPLVTVSAEADGKAAGASVDVLDRTELLFSESIVQSVAYLASLEKLYTAELTVLGTAAQASGPAVALPSQETTNSEIFEVASPEAPKTSLAPFPNEKISKMISFRSSGGQEFLLLAAQTSGRIIRLDPQTKQTRDVATGLNQPNALVIDPVTENLLVAEKDKVTTIFRNDLEAGLTSGARLGGQTKPRSGALFPIEAADGIAADECTGNIYMSDSAAGVVRQFVAKTRLVRVFFSGLQEPTQLLPVYRGGVSCPASFQMLLVEQGADRVTLLTPFNQRVSAWIGARRSTDLAFLPRENPFAGSEAVLFTESLSGQQPQQSAPAFAVITVEVPNLYSEQPVNPPPPPEEVPEPEPVLGVDLKIRVQWNAKLNCQDGTFEDSVNFTAQARLEAEPGSDPLTLRGAYTGATRESCQGTGIFAGITCGGGTEDGLLKAIVHQSKPGTSDLSGTWDVTVTVSDIEFGPEEFSFSISVTQTGDQLSSSFVFDEDLAGFEDEELSVSCPQPGQCTVTGSFGTCTLTCSPATEGCGQQVDITGTVTGS